jgi:hypothetical protein
MQGLIKKSVFVLLVGALTLAGVAPAMAASPSPAPSPAASAPAAGLTVSTPAGTLPAQPGAIVDTWLRIGNAASTPISVTILPATVKLENNGASGFSRQEDPRFAGQITFSTTEASVPANGYIEVAVKVAIPKTLIPDIYVLGFLVTPEATGSSVRVVNQIGALIALDVPGSRDRKLVASWQNAPWIIFSDHPSLTFRAKSVGKSALQFTSEDAITGFAPLTPANKRNDPLLVPSGLYRDVTVNWVTPWGFGIDTVTTTLMYPQSQSGNAQLVLTKNVIVVKPIILIIAGGVLLLLVLFIIFRVQLRRRRRARALRAQEEALEAAKLLPEGVAPELPSRRAERESRGKTPKKSRRQRH